MPAPRSASETSTCRCCGATSPALKPSRASSPSPAPSARVALAGEEVNFGKIGAYDWFDLALRFGVSENFDLTMTVMNLFDKTPPIVGSTIGYDLVQQRQHLSVDLRRSGPPLRGRRSPEVLGRTTILTIGAAFGPPLFLSRIIPRRNSPRHRGTVPETRLGSNPKRRTQGSMSEAPVPAGFHGGASRRRRRKGRDAPGWRSPSYPAGLGGPVESVEIVGPFESDELRHGADRRLEIRHQAMVPDLMDGKRQPLPAPFDQRHQGVVMAGRLLQVAEGEGRGAWSEIDPVAAQHDVARVPAHEEDSAHPETAGR